MPKLKRKTHNMIIKEQKNKRENKINTNRCNFQLFPFNLDNNMIKLGEKFDKSCSKIKWIHVKVFNVLFPV